MTHRQRDTMEQVQLTLDSKDALAALRVLSVPISVTCAALASACAGSASAISRSAALAARVMAGSVMTTDGSELE